MADDELADEGGAWARHTEYTHSDADMHARTDVNRAQHRSRACHLVALATSSCTAPTPLLLLLSLHPFLHIVAMERTCFGTSCFVCF
jgi:hypothetical protein